MQSNPISTAHGGIITLLWWWRGVLPGAAFLLFPYVLLQDNWTLHALCVQVKKVTVLSSERQVGGLEVKLLFGYVLLNQIFAIAMAPSKNSRAAAG